mgnify:CR=1 FL=1
MRQIENISLKNYNTFGIDINADHFIVIEDDKDLLDLDPSIFSNRWMVLGGGSNVVFNGDFHGTVVWINNKGKKVVEETEDDVVIEVSAGEVWHDFVMWSIDEGYNGLENLSLIPGNIGASPMQNIGAYGVEIKDCFEYLEAFSVETGTFKKFSHSDCAFGYRESVFKNKLKGKYIITKVTYRLKKKSALKLSYGAIQHVLEEKGIHHPNAKDVSNAVISIRRSKLPDPKDLGNAGSFFKNPVISKNDFQKVQRKFPNIVYYELEDGNIKLAAGWLIENAGWKGKKNGACGVHANQALILVNYGSAKGEEIIELSQFIQEDVWNKYGIKLHCEVNFVTE